MCIYIYTLYIHIYIYIVHKYYIYNSRFCELNPLVALTAKNWRCTAISAVRPATDYFLQDQGGRNVWHLAALAGHERPDPVKWPERKEENGFWVTIQ